MTAAIVVICYQAVVGTCYATTTESIRRVVIDVIPQTTLVGCQMLCTADANVSSQRSHCSLFAIPVPMHYDLSYARRILLVSLLSALECLRV